MSNPTFRSGPISFAVKSDVKKFRLVKVSKDGVEHAGATGAVFGAVTENGFKPVAAEVNSLVPQQPNIVAVHVGPATVPLEVEGGTASAIEQGSPVYAADDGKVKADGDHLVGFAARNGEGTTVKTLLVCPIKGE